jgi:hypothetical protein
MGAIEMVIRTVKKILQLLNPTREEYALKYSAGVRKATERKIDSMIADLNGCSDQWFLTPRSTLDECIPSDEELDLND